MKLSIGLKRFQTNFHRLLLLYGSSYVRSQNLFKRVLNAGMRRAMALPLGHALESVGYVDSDLYDPSSSSVLLRPCRLLASKVVVALILYTYLNCPARVSQHRHIHIMSC